ncbi:molybdopterin-dependent oxidoreductase [Halopenitus salinus]|uniref:Molybdopterin-dependent oxidoreductase n=1 Tax=Halopenitus salinus TaxID=1198295 RepID=A0ABD5UXG8_9EURY
MNDLERHGVPEEVETDGWTLEVTGSVDDVLSLTRADLESFARESIVDDFVCEEGWTAEGLRWEGIRVASILERAGVSDAGEYGLVRALDSGYACSFPIERLADSVLAVELDGESLALEHGGPARLVPVGNDRDCWESVKWVSAIEVRKSEPTAADTAKDAALSRVS